jgi:tetratricopeptide (TPR) repeat protein
VTYVEQALSITTSEHERAELQELAATAGSHAAHYETAIVSATAAIAAYRSDGDVDGVARASDLLGTIQIDASLLTEARETLVTALGEVAARPEHRDGARRAVLEARQSRVLMRVSEYPAAIEAADRALAIAERDRLEAIVAEALINKGSTLGGLGRWREGSALLEASVRIAERIGDIDSELRGRNNLASTIWFEEPERALAMVDEALDVGRRIGRRSNNIWMASVVGFGEYSAARDWDRALRLVEEFLDDGLADVDRRDSSASGSR